MNKTYLNPTLTFVSILNIHIKIGSTIKSNQCHSSTLVSMNKTHLNSTITFVPILNIRIQIGSTIKSNLGISINITLARFNPTLKFVSILNIRIHEYNISSFVAILNIRIHSGPTIKPNLYQILNQAVIMNFREF